MGIGWAGEGVAGRGISLRKQWAGEGEGGCLGNGEAADGDQAVGVERRHHVGHGLPAQHRVAPCPPPPPSAHAPHQYTGPARLDLGRLRPSNGLSVDTPRGPTSAPPCLFLSSQSFTPRSLSAQLPLSPSLALSTPSHHLNPTKSPLQTPGPTRRCSTATTTPPPRLRAMPPTRRGT
jgi:hypothetical protein